MARFKVKARKSKSSNNRNEDKSPLPEAAIEPVVPQPEETGKPQVTEQTTKSAPQPTDNSSQSVKTRVSGATRSVCTMHKVVMKKVQGKQLKVQYNKIGIPVGDTRPRLQSYIGMLARTLVPIDIPTWPQVDVQLKEKLWSDIQDTFQVAPESRSLILKSAGAKWRQFKATLTAEHVMPYLGKKKKLDKPPKKYKYVGKGPWRRFVAMRTTKEWLAHSKAQSERVAKRKYPHRVSRKGYVGIQEEEISSGRTEPDEVPDRAIFWKKARKRKDGEEEDEELAKTFETIDTLLEKQRKGEFKAVGSKDVLTTALQTPEHFGRVRGVGSFVSPSVFFNLPKDRIRITKAELLERDRQREEEHNKRTAGLESRIAELESLIHASNLHSSPNLSDKASCQQRKENEELFEEKKSSKPGISKDLEMDYDNDVDCVAVDPPSPEKMGPRKCELAVGNIKNIVAFGVVFGEGDNMGPLVHGVPLKSGCRRVSIDGVIKPDELVPVPVVGEIETVQQALASQLAWPEDMIIFNSPANIQKKSNKIGLKRVQPLFNTVKPKSDLPARFKLLYKHATTSMIESGVSIQIPCDNSVFGFDRTIFILHENVQALLDFDMIGQNAISTYMAYLYTLVGKSDLYSFVDPSISIKLNSDFEQYIIQRLNDGVLRMHFMPYNYDCHWILVVIWDSDIFILNPLPQRPHPPQLETAVVGAVRSYNAQKGRVNKKPTVKKLAGCPKQPGGHECGYVVCRYIKDIIDDTEQKILNRWVNKDRKSYTKEELNVVRFEILDYIQEIMPLHY